MNRFRSIAITTFAATAALVLGVVPTAAAGKGNGCPAAFDLRTVASLAETGNAPNPGLLDAAGNNDGLVCARPLPDAACPVDPCPVETLYLFVDNDVPIH